MNKEDVILSDNKKHIKTDTESRFYEQGKTLKNFHYELRSLKLDIREIILDLKDEKDRIDDIYIKIKIILTLLIILIVFVLAFFVFFWK